MRFARPRIARAAVALPLLLLALGLPFRDGAANSAARLLPEGLPLPEAEALIPLEGERSWNGSPVESLVFTTAASPEEIVAEMRAQWADRPVEIFESVVAEGRALSVYDFHGGLRWTLVARRVGEGRTEAIRSLSPLGEAPPEDEPLPFLLPAGIELVSLLGDEAGGRVHTAAAVEMEADGLEAICEAAGAAGWGGRCEVAESGDFVELVRGEERLHLGFVEGPLGRRWLHLRWEMP